MPDQERLQVVYRVQGDTAQAESVARAIAYEQTVELPESQVEPRIRTEMVGEVGRIEVDPKDAGAQRVTIAYHSSLASGQLGQLFNLLYGNISMYSGIRLLRVDLPADLIACFQGPRHGITGIRKMTGVYGRPLLATALKPRGATNSELARMAGEFALAGGDIIKDDQNLVDASFDAFRVRVDSCAAAVAKANAQTGRRCLYLPHLAGRDEVLEPAAVFIHARGLAGALICPLLTGLDRARALAGCYNLVFMAHPALTGAYTNGGNEGIEAAFLLGTLFRLAGADISVFPAPGGRFNVTPGGCKAIGQKLREPLGTTRTTFPGPAGGMRIELVPQIARDYGRDTVLLVGGSLLGHPHGVQGGTRDFLAALRGPFGERLEEPGDEHVSACELPSITPAAVHPLLVFRTGFHWMGRPDQAYKQDDALRFRSVRRVELVGKNGESCGFDLRYFELEPGGFTSLEKHRHAHVLVGARGSGRVQIDARNDTLSPDDIAYIGPLQVHQLVNEGREPFGFYCIVDRQRDRPMAP